LSGNGSINPSVVRPARKSLLAERNQAFCPELKAMVSLALGLRNAEADNIHT